MSEIDRRTPAFRSPATATSLPTAESSIPPAPLPGHKHQRQPHLALSTTEGAARLAGVLLAEGDAALAPPPLPFPAFDFACRGVVAGAAVPGALGGGVTSPGTPAASSPAPPLLAFLLCRAEEGPPSGDLARFPVGVFGDSARCCCLDGLDAFLVADGVALDLGAG